MIHPKSFMLLMSTSDENEWKMAIILMLFDRERSAGSALSSAKVSD